MPQVGIASMPWHIIVQAQVQPILIHIYNIQEPDDVGIWQLSWL